MTKKSIKAESLKRLRAIMEDYKTDEELYSSKAYKNLQHFFNQYEKDNAEEMVNMIRKGYTNQQIIKSINERTRTMVKEEKSTATEATATATDPVAEETEKVFIGYHLADGPVEVKIDGADPEKTETENKSDKSQAAKKKRTESQSKEIKERILSDDPAISKSKNDSNEKKKMEDYKRDKNLRRRKIQELRDLKKEKEEAKQNEDPAKKYTSVLDYWYGHVC